jgi:hypothetical protein
METRLRSKLYWGIFLLVVSGAGLVLHCRGRDHNPRLPPADDAFLSYLQAAHGLARLLVGPPNSVIGANRQEQRQEQIAKAIDELERLQAEAAALPPSEIQRLTLAEKNLVAQVRRAWDDLALRHAKSPSFPGADWPRLEAAFRLCCELNPPKN